PADSSVSWSRGGSVYYTRTAVGKEYGLFCVSDCDLLPEAPTDRKNERILLDLNVFAADVPGGADYVDLGVCEPSPDGQRLAWSVDTEGNEVFTLWIRDLDSGSDEPVTGRSYFSCAWSADSSTLFYTVPDD